MTLDFDRLRLINLARCTAPSPQGFNHSLCSWSVAEWGNAAAGELGEACNVAKKMLRFRDNVSGNKPGMSRDDYKKALASEIAGTLIYLDLWAASEGLDLGEIVRDEFNSKSIELGSEIKL